MAGIGVICSEAPPGTRVGDCAAVGEAPPRPTSASRRQAILEPGAILAGGIEAAAGRHNQDIVAFL